MSFARLLGLVSCLCCLSFAFGCDDSGNGGNDGDGGDGAMDSGHDAANDGDDLDAGDDAEVVPPTHAEQLVSAICDAARNCPGQDDDMVLVGAAFGDNCEEVLNGADSDVDIDEVSSQEIAQLQTAVEGGTISLDDETFQDCLQGLADCAGLSAVYGPCLGAFEGQVELGDACEISWECATGHCEHAPADTCGGTCVEGGSSYSFTFEVVGEEDPCGEQYVENGQHNLLCPNGLACTDQVEGENSYLGTCNTPKAAGTACTREGECAIGTTCWNEECKTITVGGLHDECNYSFRDENSEVEGNEVKYCNAWIGLDCIEGSCEDYADGTEGSSCKPWIDHCNAGLFCSYNSYECETPAANGDPCQQSDGCTSGICISQTSECAATCTIEE